MEKSSFRVALALCSVVFLLFAFGVLPTCATENPNAHFTYSPDNPLVGDNIQFMDDSTDDDGEISARLWDFGDNENSSLKDPTHQYSNTGTYTVTLTVIDADNLENSYFKNITVRYSTTLSINPENFTVNLGEDQVLTATLTSGDNNPMQDKLITLSTDSGSLSPQNENTDANGAVTFTFTAPPSATTATIIASYAGDPENFFGCSDNSTATVQFSFIITFLQQDNSPLTNTTIYYGTSAGQETTQLDVTNENGDARFTDNSLALKKVYFKSQDGKYGWSAYVGSSGGSVTADFEAVAPTESSILVVVAIVVIVCVVVVVGATVVRKRKGVAKKAITVIRKPAARVSSFIGYKSDVGKVRSLDEDTIEVLDLSAPNEPGRVKKVLAIVADGMGGHAKGEVASKICADEITKAIRPLLSRNTAKPREYENAVREGFDMANQEVIGYALDHPECAGMGSTASVAILDGDQLYVGHVGDTRVYTVDGGITQVTKDHSLVQELIDEGEIKPEDAKRHPQKNVITRAVGIKPKLKVDTYSKTLRDGSYVLVCCDGLVNEVEDEKIRDVVLGSKNPQEACDKLVALANEHGGRDNISVVVLGPVGGVKSETLDAKTIIRKPSGK
jgi:protein phosphatase